MLPRQRVTASACPTILLSRSRQWSSSILCKRLHYQPRAGFSSKQSNRGSLEGKEIAIKDNIATSNLPTSASSNILTGFTTPFEATVVKRLKEHGAKITLKTDLDEFGMGSHTQTAAAGPVLSPYKRHGVALSPGGSSGGSAIAVATGRAWAALGTDTGGSVRLPAAYTGVVGFKPSYGLLSRCGVIQYANSLDTVGILSRDVISARQVFDALNAFDKQDPTSLLTSTRARIELGRRAPPKALRIGVPKEYNITELNPVVREAWTGALQKMKELGHSLHAISLPTTQQALSAYYVLAPAEASSNLAKYDGIRYGRRNSQDEDPSAQKLPLYARARDRGFGAEVKRRILLGAYTLSSEAIDNYFIQAQKVRRLVQLDFDGVFSMQNPLLDTVKENVEGVDILLAPTAPTLPPTVEEVKKLSPSEIYMNDVFTVPASLAGLPAISIPVPLVNQQDDPDDIQSIGLQVIGQFGDDEMVLDIGDLVHSTMKKLS